MYRDGNIPAIPNKAPCKAAPNAENIMKKLMVHRQMYTDKVIAERVIYSKYIYRLFFTFLAILISQ